MKLFLLNGPPSSGKDTAGKLLKMWFDEQDSNNPITVASLEKLSEPIKLAFGGMMGEDWQDYEATKEEVIPILGVSFRQWQIDFSEKFMKPLYGNTIFSRLLIAGMNRSLAYAKEDGEEWIYIVTDCGFQIEIDSLCAAFSASDVCLFRLYRHGCNFKNDSRQYVVQPTGGRVYNIINTTLDKFEHDLISATKHFLSGEMPS